jgi:hypothetical protein
LITGTAMAGVANSAEPATRPRAAALRENDVMVELQ